MSAVSKPHSELRTWIEDWRAGQFDSGSRDKHGWPIEMHGLVLDLESLLEQLDSMRNSLVRARSKLMIEVHAPQTLSILDDAIDGA